MTPGLANGPPFPAKAKQGSVVAIASLESPSVPVVVGRCEIDVSALGSVQGSRGHAVQTMHWAGDEMWAYGPTGKTGTSPPDHIQAWLPDHVDEQEINTHIASMGLDDDEEGGVEVGSGPQDRPMDNEPVADAENVQMTIKGDFHSPTIVHYPLLTSL